MLDDNYARWTNHDYIGSFGRIPNEPKKPKSKKEKHVEFESQLEFSPDICFESDPVVSPDLKVEESEIAVSPDNMSADSYSHPSSKESSHKVIPEDITLPSQFLLPTLDDSSSEETEITELKTEAKIHDMDNEEEMPLQSDPLTLSLKYAEIL